MEQFRANCSPLKKMKTGLELWVDEPFWVCLDGQTHSFCSFCTSSHFCLFLMCGPEKKKIEKGVQGAMATENKKEREH